MKKINRILIVSFLSFLVSSCVVMEETRFNDNGSVYYSLLVDASQMMEIFSESNDSAKIDSQQKLDTIISFSELYDENIDELSPDERKAFERMKNFNLKMKTDNKTKQFSFQIYGDFADFNSLQNAITNVDSIQKLLPNTEGFDISTFNRTTMPFGKEKIEWNGKIFKKSIALLPVTNDSLDEDVEGMMGLFTQGKYTSTYTFARKIKNVDNAAASISADGKTVTFTFDLQEYSKNPEKSNVVIELEN